jgi:3D (Asp-Asp-Asp) domain-containing protein
MLSKHLSHSKWFCVILLLLILGMLFAYDGSMVARLLQEKAPMPAEAAKSVQAKAEPRGSIKVSGTEGAAEPAAPSGSFTDFLLRNLERYEAVEVTATGYYAGKESTGKSPGHPEYGITYSGVKARRDARAFSTIAADPNVFPIGTLLYIPGYGFGIVADTGSAIKGNKIDLYFDTKDQIYEQWGKQNVKVYIIMRGDGKVTEVMMNRLNRMLLSAGDLRPAGSSESRTQAAAALYAKGGLFFAGNADFPEGIRESGRDRRDFVEFAVCKGMEL